MSLDKIEAKHNEYVAGIAEALSSKFKSAFYKDKMVDIVTVNIAGSTALEIPESDFNTEMTIHVLSILFNEAKNQASMKYPAMVIQSQDCSFVFNRNGNISINYAEGKGCFEVDIQVVTSFKGESDVCSRS